MNVLKELNLHQARTLNTFMADTSQQSQIADRKACCDNVNEISNHLHKYSSPGEDHNKSARWIINVNSVQAILT